MLRIAEEVAPATPPTGKIFFYADIADSKLKTKNDAGTVSILGPGATGATGAAGADGNTILNGTAAPTTEGVNGDFYIRTSTNYIYGPKAAGVWPAGVPLGGGGGGGGAYVPTGTRGSPYAASTNTLPIADIQREIRFVVGDTSPIALGGTPRIAAGSVVGQELKLIGTSDTNWLKIPDTGAGVMLNGDCILMNNSVLTLIWDGTIWLEDSRNDK